MKTEAYCYSCNKGFGGNGMKYHKKEAHRNTFKKGITKTCKFCVSWLASQEKAFLEAHLRDKHPPGWEPHLSEAAKKAAEKKKK